uniref:alpha/beta hydrolase n=1 Tax=Stenotrophomonas sp. SrG TaxID=3414430 RepID=UPI003CEADDCC
IAGLIALSTYLPDPEAAIKAAIADGARPPVFMAHGAQDPVIPQVSAADTAQRLTAAGFPLEWQSYSMAPQVCAEVLQARGAWLDA